MDEQELKSALSVWEKKPNIAGLGLTNNSMLFIEFPGGYKLRKTDDIVVSFRAVYDEASNFQNETLLFQNLLHGDRDSYSPARLEGIGNAGNKFNFKITDKSKNPRACVCKLNVRTKRMEWDSSAKTEYYSDNLQLQMSAHKKFVDPTANRTSSFFACLEDKENDLVFHSPLIVEMSNSKPWNENKKFRMTLVRMLGNNWTWTKPVDDRSSSRASGMEVENSSKKTKSSVEEEEEEEEEEQQQEEEEEEQEEEEKKNTPIVGNGNLVDLEVLDYSEKHHSE